MKVFISQPMWDRPDDEVAAERAVLESMVKIAYPNQEVVVMDTFREGLGNTCNPLSLLGMAIQAMAHADLVVFARGWEKARGCRIEHDCAVEYDKDILLWWVLRRLVLDSDNPKAKKYFQEI